MMRRLTKEELYRFDGTPLFPERRAYTASYELSKDETILYEGVTKYVRRRWTVADRVGDDKEAHERRLCAANSASSSCLVARRDPPLAPAPP